MTTADSRRMDAAVDNDVIEIVPLDEYDKQKSKLRASLLWVLHKAYRDDVPEEFMEPFYEAANGLLHVKPHLVNMLVSGELYCAACSRMFPESSTQWQGHWSIIQAVSRKGIYVLEPDDMAVTETSLMQTAPFRVISHLALMDAMMLAYAGEIVSVERVVQCVRRFATFNASSELPSGVEGSILFWVNKVCQSVQHRLESERQALQEQKLIHGDSNQKVRIVSRNTPVPEAPSIPLMKDLLEDVGDGCSLAVVISFYCPQYLKLEDICLKSNVGIADSLYNLRLIRNFCDRYLPTKCFHLSYEDLLYTQPALRQNVVAFLVEMFCAFEVKKFQGECLQNPVANYSEDKRPTTAKNLTSPCIANVSISNATKKSFHKPVDEASTVTPIPARQSLLPKRLQQHQDAIADESHGPQHSLSAWQSPAPGSRDLASQSQGSSLLANVSIDSDMDVNESLGSLDLGDLCDTPRTLNSVSRSALHDPDHPEYMEIQSVTSGQGSSRASNRTEPLMPARLKPAKEKLINHTKEEERGDMNERGKMASPPRMLAEPDSRYFQDVHDSSVSVSPLPPGELSYSLEGARIDQSNAPGARIDQSNAPSHVADSRELPEVLSARSYSIPDQIYTCETARAAGIPVVTESRDGNILRRNGSRHGSTTSSRSSGDFSDHESQKIHYDHKARESGDGKQMTLDHSDVMRPDSLMVNKSELIITDPKKASVEKFFNRPARTTTFAEIKKNKENFENSGLVYMQHGQEPNVPKSGTLKSAFNKNRPSGSATYSKKTSFAILPNQTTWQQTAPGAERSKNTDVESPANGSMVPLASELLQVRLKLEEKRRMIERKKHRMEVQQNKVRQRIGKAAFMQVLSKKDPGENAVQNGQFPQSRPSEPFQEASEPVPSVSHSEEDARIPPMHAPMSDNVVAAPSDPYMNTPIKQGMPVGPVHSTPKSQAEGSRRSSARQAIQETIDNVRKKWFPEASSTAQDENLGVAALDESDNTPPEDAVENYDQYGNSLDKLNQSLSELQGEIMRLSLQQEQIKSVTDDGREEARHSPTPPPNDPRLARQSQSPGPMDPRMTRQTRSPARGDLQRTQQTLSATDQSHLPLQQHDPMRARSPMPPTSLQTQPGMDRYVADEKAGVRPPYSLPSQGYLAPHGQPVGAVPYPGSTQFAPPACMPGQIGPGGYVMGQTFPVHQYPPAPQVYQPHILQSPPYQPQPYPGQPYMVQQPYQPQVISTCQYQPSVPPVRQFQAIPHMENTYTVQSQPRQPLPSSFQTKETPSHVQQVDNYRAVPSEASSYDGAQDRQQRRSSPRQQSPQRQNTPPRQTSPPRQPSPPRRTSPQRVAVPSKKPSTPPLQPSPPRQTSPPPKEHLVEPPTFSPEQKVETLEPEPSHDAVHEKHFYLNPDDIAPQGNSVAETSVDEVPEAGDQFYVSFGSDTPKRPKPVLTRGKGKKASHSAKVDEKKKIEPATDVSHTNVANVAQPEPCVAPAPVGTDSPQSRVTQGLDVKDSPQTDQETIHSSPGVAFVLVDNDSILDKSGEDDLQKKKDRLLQQQVKRKEDSERKRLEKEAVIAKRKEQERIKQEGADQRKLDEKARREQIFQQYLVKKREQEDEDHGRAPVHVPERPAARKPRPKSMIVKTKTAPVQPEAFLRIETLDDMATTQKSTPEKTRNLAPSRLKKPATYSSKMRKAVSYNQLPQSYDRSQLSFGGRTHRRPPSPDLFNLPGKKGSLKSDSASDTGSLHGSDPGSKKKFGTKSNRSIISNALSDRCLAGIVNADNKSRVLEELMKSEASHFVILFRDAGQQYKGLFAYYQETDELIKVYGVGPKVLKSSQIEKFYKYNSGSKEFKEVTSTKHISVSIDAVVPFNAIWKTNRVPTSKRY